MRNYICICICAAMILTLFNVSAKETEENENACLSANVTEVTDVNGSSDNNAQEAMPETEPTENETDDKFVTEEEKPGTPVLPEDETEDQTEIFLPTLDASNDGINFMTSDTWEDVSGMNIPRTEEELVTVNGELYAVAGKGDDGYLRSIEKYNDVTDTWTYVTDIPGAEKGAKAIAHDTYIYLVGGYGEEGYSNKVRIYDTVSDMWSDLPNMKEKRDQPAVLFTDNKLYVFGGRNGMGHVRNYEYYDMEENKWEIVAS